MNTGTAAASVSVSYHLASTGQAVGVVQSIVLQPNASWSVYQPTGGLPTGTRATAVVTVSGSQIAVICNESSASSFMSYGGQ
jgi:hypothetical protein